MDASLASRTSTRRAGTTTGSLRDARAGEHAHRQRVDGEASELWQLVAHPRPGLTRESRAQRVVGMAENLLAAGGDVAGVLPEDFRPPAAEARRHSRTTPTTLPR